MRTETQGILWGLLLSLFPDFCIWQALSISCAQVFWLGLAVMVGKGTAFTLLFALGQLNTLTQASRLGVLFPNGYWTQTGQQLAVSANLHFGTSAPAG